MFFQMLLEDKMDWKIRLLKDACFRVNILNRSFPILISVTIRGCYILFYMGLTVNGFRVDILYILANCPDFIRTVLMFDL